MQATITTPRGSKIRSQSQRRFILIRETVRIQDNTPVRAAIEKRSDKAATLRLAMRPSPRLAGSETFESLFIIDTVTGLVV